MKYLTYTRLISFILPLIVATVVAVVVSNDAFAASCGGEQTSVVSCDNDINGIWGILLIIINILAAGVGVVAVGGLVYAALLYSSAADNASQIAQAKSTITNVVIGIVTFSLVYSSLQFIIPGGVMNSLLNPPDASTIAAKKKEEEKKKAKKSGENVKADSTVKTIRVTHLHSSGRYDRSTATWRKELKDFDTKYSPSVITLTETSNRSSVMDWKNWAHTSAESIVAWDTTIWKKVDARVIELAPQTPSRLPSVMSVVVLEHRQTKAKWLWTSSHIPAHVDAGNGNFRGDEAQQVGKWKATMSHMSSIANDTAQKYDIKRRHVVLTADWNINLAQSAWRAVAKGYFPTRTPSNPTGSAGTHGNRTIDTSFVSDGLTVTRWSSLGTISSSDHKPFLAKYRADK